MTLLGSGFTNLKHGNCGKKLLLTLDRHSDMPLPMWFYHPPPVLHLNFLSLPSVLALPVTFYGSLRLSCQLHLLLPSVFVLPFLICQLTFVSPVTCMIPYLFFLCHFGVYGTGSKFKVHSCPWCLHVCATRFIHRCHQPFHFLPAATLCFVCRGFVFCCRGFVFCCHGFVFCWRSFVFCCRGFGMVVFVAAALAWLFFTRHSIFWWPRSCFWCFCCRGFGVIVFHPPWYCFCDHGVVFGFFVAVALAWLILLPRLWRGCFCCRSSRRGCFCCRGFGVVVFVAAASAWLSHRGFGVVVFSRHGFGAVVYSHRGIVLVAAVLFLMAAALFLMAAALFLVAAASARFVLVPRRSSQSCCCCSCLLRAAGWLLGFVLQTLAWVYCRDCCCCLLWWQKHRLVKLSIVLCNFPQIQFFIS